MIQLTLFIVCNSEKEASNIVTEFVSGLSNEIKGFDITSNEVYWKIEEWYRVTCNLKTVQIPTKSKAEDFLQEISDRWEWDGNECSAHSSMDHMGATFTNSRIKFATCWFEDLES